MSQGLRCALKQGSGDCDIAELLRESSNRPTEKGVVLAHHLARLNSADRSMLLELVEKLSDRLANPIA